jgi:hypothetical protein
MPNRLDISLIPILLPISFKFPAAIRLSQLRIESRMTASDTFCPGETLPAFESAHDGFDCRVIGIPGRFNEFLRIELPLVCLVGLLEE